jgi:hypothetical protein
MKISLIANRLHDLASKLDDVAEENDYEFPDSMVLPLLQNMFVDDKWIKTLILDDRRSPSSPTETPSSEPK